MIRLVAKNKIRNTPTLWIHGSALGLGLFFLLVSASKLWHVYDSRGTMDVLVIEMLSDTNLPLSYISIFLTSALIGIEAALGTWLIARYKSPQIPARAAGFLLLAFTGVLLLMLQMDNPPSCGCLGSWDILAADARTATWLGIARNTGLLLLIYWIVLATSNKTSISVISYPKKRPGFTLVETLVILAILGIILALLLPTLASAKRQGRKAETLSAHRQSAVAIIQYTEAEDGFLPYLGIPGNPDAGTLPGSDWGDFGAPPYFRGQARLWPTALLHHGLDLSMLPQNTQSTEDPTQISTYLWMTHAAVSRPEYWIGIDPPISQHLFSGVRLFEVLYPSKKGLLADVGHLDDTSTNWTVALFDGSAATHSIIEPPIQIEDLPRKYGAVPWRVLTTHEGIHGQDY